MQSSLQPSTLIHVERPLRGGWSTEGHSEEVKYENRDNYKERILGGKLEWDTTWTKVEMERKKYNGSAL